MEDKCICSWQPAFHLSLKVIHSTGGYSLFAQEDTLGGVRVDVFVVGSFVLDFEFTSPYLINGTPQCQVLFFFAQLLFLDVLVGFLLLVGLLGPVGITAGSDMLS